MSLSRISRRSALIGAIAASAVLAAGPVAAQSGQALRGAIAWSYDLLDGAEQALFRRFGVFRGGANLGFESSINKVFRSTCDIATHETALDILGTSGELAGEQWMDGYLFALSGPIYAGTNEVQKNIIAERLLGLPRG